MTLLVFSLGLIMAGGGIGAMSRDRVRAPIVSLLTVGAGCGTGVIATVRVLADRVPISMAIAGATPGGPWIIGLDGLSAVFLLPIFAVGAMCAASGTPDAAKGGGHGGSRANQLTFAALLASVTLVVVARSVVVFLIAWELMAITSYLLIVADHDDAVVRRAGLLYLVVTHTATLALLAMFAVLSQSGPDWSFEALARTASAIGTGGRTAVLLLALVGFGLKAGFVPFHSWLPPAHAAAPSHVSALMSGIVIKIGIYGLLRLLLLLGGAPAWWGWLVLGIGIVSGVLGVLWALAQHDIKRLLAYHSVENIGIILMGTGIGVLGVAHGVPAIAVLGFAGAVLHTVNHALFKSLLFLAAGAVFRATGTRNMEELGGLARRMPRAWLGFIVGAAAIVGLPPLNGFVSEWLIYQGLFQAGRSREVLRLALFGVPALALIGGLALACFAKVAGVVFLGSPRTARAAAAQDGPPGLLAPMAFLAGACAVLGVVPILGVSLATVAATALSGADGMPVAVLSGAWTISIVALGMIGLGVALWALRRSVAKHVGIRHGPTWACGYAAVTPRMQYTASSFAAPLLSVFGPVSSVSTERVGLTLRTHPFDAVLDRVALPLWSAVKRAALRLRPIQQGRLHFYLLYVMAALLVMLAYLAFFGSRA